MKPGRFLRIGLGCALLSNAAAAAAGAYSPAGGERHPDFTFPAIDDGRPVSLSQFRGQKALLIHFASW